jgi:hypothetical protein
MFYKLTTIEKNQTSIGEFQPILIEAKQLQTFIKQLNQSYSINYRMTSNTFRLNVDSSSGRFTFLFDVLVDNTLNASVESPNKLLDYLQTTE